MQLPCVKEDHERKRVKLCIKDKMQNDQRRIENVQRMGFYEWKYDCQIGP